MASYLDIKEYLVLFPLFAPVKIREKTRKEYNNNNNNGRKISKANENMEASDRKGPLGLPSMTRSIHLIKNQS